MPVMPKCSKCKVNAFLVLFNSFDRKLCEHLSRCLTEEFEDREAVLRAQGDPKTLKLVEKRREKAEKRLKKTRDQTDKEKGNRYFR